MVIVYRCRVLRGMRCGSPRENPLALKRLVPVGTGDVVAVLDGQHWPEQPGVEDGVERHLVTGATPEAFGVVGDECEVGAGLEVGEACFKGNKPEGTTRA